MENENTDDIAFKLLANPSKLKKKNKQIIFNEDDELFLKIIKRYPEMVILKSDKVEILKKIETLLTEITIANIVGNLINEIEYGHLL